MSFLKGKAAKLLSRDDILAAPEASVTFEDVEVPEWGGAVRVKALNGAERDRFEASLSELKGKKIRLKMDNVRARLVAKTVIDEQGQLLFKPQDVEVLGKKSAAALDRVFSVAQRLAGLRDEDLEELTENFTDDPSDSSTSD